MGLLDEIKQQKRKRTGTKSVLLSVLDSLPFEDAQDLVEAIFDKSCTADSIEKVLANRGVVLRAHVVAQWRNNKRVEPIPARYYR